MAGCGGKCGQVPRSVLTSDFWNFTPQVMQNLHKLVKQLGKAYCEMGKEASALPLYRVLDDGKCSVGVAAAMEGKQVAAQRSTHVDTWTAAT